MKYFAMLLGVLLLGGCANSKSLNLETDTTEKELHPPHAVLPYGEKLGPQAEQLLAGCTMLNGFASFANCSKNTRLPFTRIQIEHTDWSLDSCPEIGAYICAGDCDDSGKGNYPYRYEKLEMKDAKYRMTLTLDRKKAE